MLDGTKGGRVARRGALLCALMQCAFPNPAWAQDTVPPADGASQASPEDQGAGEIVVTARYRSESLARVGQSITAMSGEDIQKSGIVDFSDLARQTPSLSFAYNGPGRNTPLIRGLASANTGQNDALQTPQVVGTYFDDIPINSATTSQRDVPFYDLGRIEVLRGPQGTLYGEGSIGGTIRYLTADPDLDEVAFSGGASIGHVRKAGKLDYVLDGTVNVPLATDRAGIRLTGFRRYDAGYIDSTLDGNSDYNSRSSYGGRVVFLARPTERFTLRAVAQVEKNSGGGVGTVTGNAADQVNTSRPFPTTLDDTSQLYGLKLSYETGIGTISSITGYYRRGLARDGYDPGIRGLFGGNPSTLLDNRDRSLSQELRYVSTFDGPFNLVAGLFYKRTTSRSHGRSVSTAPAYVAYDSQQNQTEKQYAAFGELYFQATQSLRLTAGLRYFTDKIDVVNANQGGTVLFASPTQTTVSKDLSALVPKAAIEFQATRDILLYGSVSRGARNGGINNVAVVASLPAAQRAAALGYDDDNVTAYELGTKFYLAGRKIYVEAAAFYNKWNDYQVSIPAPLLNYIQSVGKAHTKGIEGSIRWQVMPELALSGGGSLIEAKLDAATPTVAAGTRLTNVPDYNLNLAADVDIPVGAFNIVGRANFVSIGDGYQSFTNQVPTANSFRPGYDLLNLNAGVRTDHWSLIAYADNVTNQLVLIQNVAGGAPGPLGERIITRPRSFRLTFRFNF